MSEQQQIPKFFVPGLAKKWNYKFLSAMGKEEKTLIKEKIFRIKFNNAGQVFTAQVGMPHPYFPEDPEDCVRFILRKDEVYKIFVCTPRHIVIDIQAVLDTVQFTE